MKKFFDKLPFRKLAEKIPANTRAKIPVLDKMIPYMNQIVCGLIILLLALIITFSGGSNNGGGSRTSPTVRFSQGEYLINSGVKIYDADLKELQSKITYYPQAFHGFNNVVFIYFKDYANISFLYGKIGDSDKRAEFIRILEKAVEWAETAEKNNVESVSRLIEETNVIYTMPGVIDRLDAFIAYYYFSIQEINRRKEVMLIVNYKTVQEANSNEQGDFIVIKQNDFKKLLEILSNDFISRIDKMWEQQHNKENLLQ
jgi:hypothetical protein